MPQTVSFFVLCAACKIAEETKYNFAFGERGRGSEEWWYLGHVIKDRNSKLWNLADILVTLR